MCSQKSRILQALAAAGLLLFGAASPAWAQFTVPWFTIDGGGGDAAGGSYALSGTIGQMDVRSMSGGSFTLAGGFWSGAVVPAPCPGDLNGGGQVGQADLGLLLASYGLCPGDPGYVPAAGKLAGDPCVTQADLGVLLSNYGLSCP